MTPTRSGLTGKGLLLVAVPLILQFFLLSYMGVLLQQSEQQARKLDLYKEMMGDASAVNKLSMECVRALVAHGASRSSETEQSYDRIVLEIQQRLRRIMEIVRGNPKQQSALERVMVVSQSFLDLLDDAKDRLNQLSGTGSLSGITPKGVAQLSRRVIIELDAFVAQVKESGRVDPADVERLGWLIKLCVVAGLVISLSFVVLAIVFYKQITERLSVLLDNSRRLAAGEQLNPVVAGADEISSLDKAFHNMAEALREADRKERAVVDNALDVICSIESSGLFRKVNPAAQAMFGYLPEEMIGHSFADFVLEEDRQKAAEALAALKAGAMMAPFEFRIIRKDGSQVYVLWSAHWSESEQSWFCVVHDITDRKELERFRQQFAAMIGHELRTPLTSMKGYLELLSEGIYGKLTESGQESTVIVEAGVNRLISLVNELLDLEKMTDGKLQMSFAQIELSEAIEDSLGNIGAYAEQQKVRLEASRTAAIAWADRNRVVQVLINLLGNAIKYTPQGGKVIVSAEALDDWVTVRVADSGPGIPEHFREKIFDRFQQVNAKEDQKRGGTGLGLTISKAIVEQHGGTIGVTSKEGEGSTFWFKLPARKLAD